MKIRSLLLGSAAAAGLATGAFAADAGTSVLSALNACDSLGLSGITIASDGNCVQITGEVKWEGNWGDYVGPTSAAAIPTATPAAGAAGAPPSIAAAGGTPVGAVSPQSTMVVGAPVVATLAATGAGAKNIDLPGAQAGNAAANLDWSSKLEWFIQVKATADTANGPASAVVKFKQVDQWVTNNEAYVLGIDSPYDTDIWPEAGTGGDHTFGIIADEAYVSVGAANIWMIGRKASILNKGDDEAFGLFQPFNSDVVDKGVFWNKTVAGNTLNPGTSVAIQTTMDLGNGFFVSGGAEKLEQTGAMAGLLVGVLEYKGDGITAHVSGVAGGFLDGVIERYAMHAGVTAKFDPVTVRAALAADDSGYWNGLLSAQATFDMFTIAGAVEAVSGPTIGGTDFGASGSVGAAVTDGVSVNVGGRWYRDASTGVDSYQGELQLVAAVTETIKLTGGVGVMGNTGALGNVGYGALEAAYAPGGDFTASAKIQIQSNGAYKGTVKAGKKFQ